jgi:CheY-like chemotaxis protein
MPTKDGLEVIKELRQGHPSTRIIALSGPNRRVGLGALPVAKLMDAAYAFDKPVGIFQPLEIIDTLLCKTIQAPDDFDRSAPYGMKRVRASC